MRQDGDARNLYDLFISLPINHETGCRPYLVMCDTHLSAYDALQVFEYGDYGSSCIRCDISSHANAQFNILTASLIIDSYDEYAHKILNFSFNDVDYDGLSIAIDNLNDWRGKDAQEQVQSLFQTIATSPCCASFKSIDVRFAEDVLPNEFDYQSIMCFEALDRLESLRLEFVCLTQNDLKWLYNRSQDPIRRFTFKLIESDIVTTSVYLLCKTCIVIWTNDGKDEMWIKFMLSIDLSIFQNRLIVLFRDKRLFFAPMVVVDVY